MKEITVTTNKIVNLAGSSIEIWRWEIPIYLFLGGMVAGIMIFSAYAIYRGKGNDFPMAAYRIVPAVPLIMSLGMLALFLDLSNKLNVWRFYTSFQITSPMSWGAWILLLVYPLSILLFLGTMRKGYPGFYARIEKYINKAYKKLYPLIPGAISKFMPSDIFKKIIRYAENNKKNFALASIPVGILLGIYTGILLSSFEARPFWNSAILGPLFLVSGASTGAALIILFSKSHKEREYFTKIDLVLIAVEFVLILLFIISMMTSSAQHKDAIKMILGGELTPAFWIFVVFMGLGFPAVLEWFELKGAGVPVIVAPVLILTGGLALRFIIVKAGQISAWLVY